MVSGQVFSIRSDLGQLPLFLRLRSSTGTEVRLTSIMKHKCANNYNVQRSQRTQSTTLWPTAPLLLVRRLKEPVSRTSMNRTRAANENERKEDTMARSGALIYRSARVCLDSLKGLRMRKSRSTHRNIPSLKTPWQHSCTGRALP